MTTSHALEAKYEAEDKEIKEETESTNLDKLPDPTGWRLLVTPFAVKEKTEGGIIIAQETLDRARVRPQGLVGAPFLNEDTTRDVVLFYVYEVLC